MKTAAKRLMDTLSLVKRRLSYGWLRTAIYVAIALVVPEYLAPVFAILAFSAALRDAVKEKRSLYAGTMVQPAFFIILLTVIGLFYTRNVMSTLGSIGLLLTAALFFLALTSEITTRRRLEITIYVITIAVAVNGIIAGVQFLIGSTLGFDTSMAFWRPFDEWFLGLFNTGMTYFEEGRADSTFCNSNVFAQSMAMLLPFGLCLACSHRNDKLHNTCRVLVPLAFFGTLFSFSRGVYLALIVILLFYGLYHIKKLRFILIAVVIIILIIPSSVYTRFISINGVQEYIAQIIQDFNNQSHANYESSLLDSIMNFLQSAISSGGVEESSRLRFDAWIRTLDLIIKNPIMGYGAGYANIRQIISEAGIPVFHTHNFILQTLMEGGLLMLSAVTWFGVQVLKKGVMLIRRTSNPKLGLSVECFIIGFFIIGLTDVPTLTPKLMASLAIALAISECGSSLYYERGPVDMETSFGFILKPFKKTKKSKNKE